MSPAPQTVWQRPLTDDQVDSPMSQGADPVIDGCFGSWQAKAVDQRVFWTEAADLQSKVNSSRARRSLALLLPRQSLCRDLSVVQQRPTCHGRYEGILVPELDAVAQSNWTCAGIDERPQRSHIWPIGYRHCLDVRILRNMQGGQDDSLRSLRP